MDQFPQPFLRDYASEGKSNPTTLGIVGAERPRRSFFWVWLIAVMLLLGAGGTALFFYHYDSLLSYAPQNCDVYMHVQGRFWKSLPANFRQLAHDHSESVGLTSTQMDTVMNTKTSMGFCYRHDGSAIFFAKNTKNLAGQLAAAAIETQASTDKRVIYFPTTTSGYWLSEPAPHITNKRTFWDFSTIHTYMFNSTVAAIPHQLREFVPEVATWGYGSLTKGTLRWQSDRIQAKTSSVSPLLTTLPTDTTFLAQNVGLNALPLPATSSTDNTTFKLIQAIPGTLSVVVRKDGSFAVLVPDSSASADQIRLALSTAIARILPSEQEKELPDKTTAINLVADPAAWPFTDDAGNQTLTVPELTLKIAVVPTEQGTLVLNNMTTQQWQELRATSAPIPMTCTKKLSSWIYVPGETILLQNYIHDMIIGLSTHGKAQICIN